MRASRPILTALAGATLLTASLSGCAADPGSARAMVEEYAALIADGTAEQLDGLAARTLTDDPEGVARAATILAGAAERIAVLAVDAGQGTTVSIANVPPDVELVTDEAVSATVRYRLDGAEQEATVTLVPRADGDRSDPATWMVAEPLMGALTMTPAAGDAPVLLDRFVAGTAVPFPDPQRVYDAPLYPGVYDLARGLEPYLTSPPQVVAVAAGPATEAPPVDLEGTAEARAALTEALVGTLEACPGSRCPDPVTYLVDDFGIEDIWQGDWSLEVLAPPELRLEGTAASFSGGAVRLTLPGGGTTDAVIEGALEWRPVAPAGEPVLMLTEVSAADD